MNSGRARWRRIRAVAGSALALVMAASSMPSHAQDSAEARLRKIEAEVRALQRKVFPGSDGKLVAPEITAGQAASSVTGTPATTPVTDVLARMDSIESQIATLTSQTEQNTFRLAQIEAQLGINAASQAAGAAAPVSSVAAAPATVTATPPASSVAPSAPAAAPVSTAPAPAAKPAATGPSAQRLAAVQAVEKPQTNDPGEDEYNYGFRLWEAKFYPEAQQQLKLYIDKYPRHSRISFGRNLLGRAFLDDGKPRDAATWFLQNYQADKSGARAPDSLIYLAQAMKQLKDTGRTCIALSEFAQTYAMEAAGRLKATYDEARAGVKCNN
ncbi:MAG: hypothetical protein M0R03_01120 [Novosphingobium sp.]|nr:hypothetical protein [Novosphingobium sp.]